MDMVLQLVVPELAFTHSFLMNAMYVVYSAKS